MSTNKKALIIVGYVSSLFCDSLAAIIVSSTAVNAYNPFVIVFWCLFSKFLISFFIYLLQNYHKNNSSIVQVLEQLWRTCSLNSKTFFLYSLPSGLYLIADILWYYNLANISPMTYSLLWQFRIVCTAIIHQRLFKRLLSPIQWLSLILLTAGCVIKQFDSSSVKKSSHDTRVQLLPYLGVLIQILLSCFAGVYNEYLLKGTNQLKALDLMIQNMFMYLNSLVLNFSIILMVSQVSQIPRFISHVVFAEPKLLFVLFNTTLLGLMTSLFLKNLDSVFRTFGAVFQIIFTAMLSWLLLDMPINLVTLSAIVIVITSLIIYVKNPPNEINTNTNKETDSQDNIKIVTEKLLTINERDEDLA